MKYKKALLAITSMLNYISETDTNPNISFRVYFKDKKDDKALNDINQELVNLGLDVYSCVFVDKSYWKAVYADTSNNVHINANLSFDLPEEEWSDDVKEDDRKAKRLASKSYLSKEQEDALEIIRDIISIGISPDDAAKVLEALSKKYDIKKKEAKI
jgi:hypothetical protein